MHYYLLVNIVNCDRTVCVVFIDVFCASSILCCTCNKEKSTGDAGLSHAIYMNPSSLNVLIKY